MTTPDLKRQRGRKQLSLASQQLLSNLLIIAVVMSGVIVFSVNQATDNFERSESRRSLSAAESLAAHPVLRLLMPTAEPEMGSALPAMAESTRSVSGLEFVSIADNRGIIITSSLPADVGSSLLNPQTEVLSGRAWRGEVRRGGDRTLVAQVPVLDDDGSLIGVIEAGQSYPNAVELFKAVAPGAVLTLLICLVLGTAGSILVSRRVRRQTRGLEPREITELFDHREALLHGVKEGIVSVDENRRITLANDVAIDLLLLPADCIGRKIDTIEIEPQVISALMTEQAEPDRQILIGEKIVVFNRMPLSSHGNMLGSVTTFRDRTELALLEQELGDTKATSNMLRAQTHEFANQLHTISGLIQLEEYSDVVRYIDGVSFSRSAVLKRITEIIADPTIAALLIAKSSVANERGIDLHVNPDSLLGRCADDLARDLATVMGNLIDNAVDALAEESEPQIVLMISESDEYIRLQVSDNGPGVDEELLEEIFTQGFSTKPSGAQVTRGFGLAISRLVCRKRGGDLNATNAQGAVFTAVMKKTKEHAND